MSIKNSSITGNAGRGLFIEATGAGTTTLLMESTVITGNLGNGIKLDAVRMGIITADFGGETLNSTGNNDISANLGRRSPPIWSVCSKQLLWGGGALTDTGGPDAGNIDGSAFDAASTCTKRKLW